MKLFPYIASIEQAYQALLHKASACSHQPAYAFNFIRCRPSHVLLRERSHPSIPLSAPEYVPEHLIMTFLVKEKYVQIFHF
jgi:hypothetical protein